ncbi:MAG TPA: PilN domain-containing protein [Archangium sp.]
MMIRINLLPVRQVQKREQGRQFLVVMVGMFIIAAAANGYWYVWMDGKREAAQRRLDDTNARIAQLEKVIGEVTNLNRRKKEVEEKLAVLDKLTKQRAGPVKLLDALATAIPKKVWITSFEEKGGAAIMVGNADSFDDVSEFMRGLNNIVWSPKGMGRVVERKRDNSFRVEMLSGDSEIIEVNGSELGFFFSNIELKETTGAPGLTKTGNKAVKFDMTLNVNLAI